MAINADPGPMSGERSRYFPSIAAGVGCRRGTPATQIIALIHSACAEANLPVECLIAIGTHARKADEPGLRAAAAHFAVPLCLFSDQALAGVTPPSPSTKVHAYLGLPGIAEAVALQAGTLLLPKHKSAAATCALGLAGPDFDITAFGDQPPNASASIASSMLATSSAGP